MALLFRVEHVAFGYHSGDLESVVQSASALRRVTSLRAAGVFGGRLVPVAPLYAGEEIRDR